jgi:hypothetical protein
VKNADTTKLGQSYDKNWAKLGKVGQNWAKLGKVGQCIILWTSKVVNYWTFTL